MVQQMTFVIWDKCHGEHCEASGFCDRFRMVGRYFSSSKKKMCGNRIGKNGALDPVGPLGAS